ncbi:hypothetical protein GH741_17535 [Aquibacillus halophilus]|uniref:Hydrolase n=1 Tax=Aquibacillus halophilus TaxID=930132 RepID=A0A6A8DL18_9BACI|nr:hypothetical protein [Aquibacillus halophilus]MRH44449.1 hypothetical protein [Aquibacillus halophilus]
MKETYYISIEAGRIDKEKIGVDHTYFEVIVDGKELYDLEYLLYQASAMDKDAAKSMVEKPLSEKSIDNKRDSFQKTLEELYRKVYELGTEETKSNIRSLGILNEET